MRPSSSVASPPLKGAVQAAQTAMPMLRWGDHAGPHGASVQNKVATSPHLSPLTVPHEPLASTGRHSALSLKCTQISPMSQPTSPVRDTRSGQDPHDPAEPREPLLPGPVLQLPLDPLAKTAPATTQARALWDMTWAQEVLKPVSSEVSTAGKPSFAAALATPEGLGDALLPEHAVGKGGCHAASSQKRGADRPSGDGDSRPHLLIRRRCPNGAPLEIPLKQSKHSTTHTHTAHAHTELDTAGQAPGWLLPAGAYQSSLHLQPGAC